MFKNKNSRQKYISNDFPEYHLGILEFLNETYSLKNKVVIDIGGSNIPEELMKEFGVKKFVCFDPVTKWGHANINGKCYGKSVYKINQFKEALENNFSFIIDDDIENVKDEMNGMFDIVLSISTFEHVTSIKETLVVAYKILKPLGIILSQNEPLFSCGAGHHVWISPEYNFNNMPELDHMHLLYSRDEAKVYLRTIVRFSDEIIEKILYQAYDSKIINRFLLKDYIESFQNAKFNNFSVQYIFFHPVETNNINRIELKFGKMRYDVRGIKYIATKD